MKKGFFIALFIQAITGFLSCCAEVGFSVGVYGPNAGFSVGNYPYGSYWSAYGPYYDSPGYYAPYWAPPYVYQQPVVVQRVIERQPVYRREPVIVERPKTWSFANKTDQPISIIMGDSKITLEPGHKINKIPQTRSQEFSIIAKESGEQKKFRSNARALDIKEKNGALAVEKK